MSYQRHIEENRRLKKLYDHTKHSCFAGAYYNTQQQRYIPYSLNKGSGYTKYLRRKSNKRIRKSQEAMKYGAYRKKFDYWWELI